MFAIVRRIREARIGRLSGEQNAERLRALGHSIGLHCSIPPSTALPLPDLIRIGDNVRFAAGVRVLPYDGSVAMIGRATGQRLDAVGPVVFRDNVFVGAGSFILKGVTLGPNVVVGCGSIVTRDFARVVIAGGPARIVRGWDEHLAELAARTRAYPWRDLIEGRAGAFDPKLEPKLNAARRAYFFGNDSYGEQRS